jgi:UDP-galactopyranose mutase
MISFVEWAGAFQRPQHLAMGLARRGWNVAYASPGYLHRRGKRFGSGLDLPAGLRVVEPPQLPGASRLAPVAAINRAWMRRALAALAPSPDGAPWDVVLFNDPRWAGVAGGLPARLRVFDCMDDLSAASPSPGWAERQERAALKVADRVWTGTFSLKERLEGRHVSARFIPCGVDAERFAHPDPAAVARARAELPAGDGPLAGYFGVLNERFDMDRVRALLDSGPWRVLLIGPATSRAPRLPDTPRVRWIGPRPYADLPAYLACFDLAIIPYRTDGPHRFLYPVKALEYLAGGKPVLTTPLPDIKRFLGEVVELADGPADWSAAGQRLAQPDAAVRQRAEAGRRLAMERSWDAMLDEMESQLRQALDEAKGAARHA